MEVKKYNFLLLNLTLRLRVPPAREARRLSLRQSLKLRAYGVAWTESYPNRMNRN